MISYRSPISVFRGLYGGSLRSTIFSYTLIRINKVSSLPSYHAKENVGAKYRVALMEYGRRYLSVSKPPPVNNEVAVKEVSKFVSPQVELLQRFVVLARHPITSVSPPHDPKAGFGDRISCYILSSGRVKAYSLPDGLVWPSFLPIKQIKEKCKNIFFERVADSNSYRRNKTIELLREGETVISIGVAGIGKSTELNSLFMEFIAHLGEHGWPKYVFYRFDFKLLMISLNEKNEPIVTEVSSNAFKASLDILTEAHAYQGVLFLELNEDETDPLFTIPCYIALPNRDAYSITKTFEKAGSVYLLIDPPRPEDVMDMVLFLSKFVQGSHFYGVTEEDLRIEIGRRVDILGPIPRYIFKNAVGFELRQENTFGRIDKIFAELNSVSVDSMPHNSKYFLAAYVKENVKVPLLLGDIMADRWHDLSKVEEGDSQAIYSINFLSSYLAAKVAEVCAKKTLNQLQESGFDYVVAERVMQHGLMAHTPFTAGHKDFLYENWEIYKNPKSGKALTKKLKLSGKDRPVIIPCKKAIDYNSMYIEQDVSELQEGALYCSLVHNAALFDALTVDHSTKVLYMFQSSRRNPEDHSLDYSTIHRVMDKLRLFDEGNMDYKVVYMYCADKTMKEGNGCTIENNSKEPLTDAKVNVIKARFTIFIARVHYFPNVSNETLLPSITK